jgi:hypothetical protein
VYDKLEEPDDDENVRSISSFSTSPFLPTALLRFFFPPFPSLSRSTDTSFRPQDMLDLAFGLTDWCVILSFPSLLPQTDLSSLTAPDLAARSRSRRTWTGPPSLCRAPPGTCVLTVRLFLFFFAVSSFSPLTFLVCRIEAYTALKRS